MLSVTILEKILSSEHHRCRYAPTLKRRRSLSSMCVACALNPFKAKKDAMISPLPSVNAHANLQTAFAVSGHQDSACQWIVVGRVSRVNRLDTTVLYTHACRMTSTLLLDMQDYCNHLLSGK